MPRFRQRLAEIDAIQYLGWNTEGVAEWAGPHARVEPAKVSIGPGIRGLTEGVSIRTVDGTIKVRPNEWIIRCVGGFRTCDPDEFAELWEPSPDPGPVYD